MSDPADQEELIRELRAYGQEHVAEWLKQLDERKRKRLAGQIAEIDLGRLQQFKELIDTPPTEISFSGTRPAPVEKLPLTPEQEEAEKHVTRLGREALNADRVAALTVAGGQGTRLRYEHAKGMYPISPIREKSLFGLFAEQILAARRRYGCRMPWFIMTGPTNDEETRDFFEQNDHFGLGADSVHFFVQGSNPIVNEDGKLLLADQDRLLVGPDGHGGTFGALARNGMLQAMREGGWDLISYFQVDNPLVTVADPRYLGHHLQKNADFSCKVVPKRDPEEGLGICVLRGGKPAIIEYIDVPQEVASERLPSGRLKYRYGSIAIHIIDVPFAERVAGEGPGLPWHVAEKQYEIFDLEAGQKHPSEPGGCYKFERFIFDALKFADRCAFVEVRRDTEFAPVKNYEGRDSPTTAREKMQRAWLEWLQKAGALEEMPRDLSETLIEISPLYASSAEELADRLPEGWEPDFPVMLEP